MEQQRQALRDSMMSLAPPTKDEVARTVFVGGITKGTGGDAGVERILRTAGILRRWTRATDADGKDCTFGFAEYDDPESLGTAVEVLKDVQVPKTTRDMKAIEAEEEVDVEMGKLLVRIPLAKSFQMVEHAIANSVLCNRSPLTRILSTILNNTTHHGGTRTLPEHKHD